MEEVVTEDVCRSIHSAQLRFARNRVPIGEGESFLKIKPLRDFQILQSSKTTLSTRGYWFCTNKCRPSRIEE